MRAVPRTAEEWQALRSRWRRGVIRVLQVAGWLVFFRYFTIPGVLMVIGWRRWRKGERGKAGWLFVGAMAVSVLAALIVIPQGLYGEEVVLLRGWRLVAAAVNLSLAGYLVCLPISWLWERLLSWGRSGPNDGAAGADDASVRARENAKERKREIRQRHKGKESTKDTKGHE